jgi:serine/threonine protein kinase
VVQTIEQKRPRRFLYYVLEYVDGKTLEQMLDDKGSLDLKTVRELVPQIASGLRAFHRLDMLHQDLKPGNIMVTHDGVLKIIDFGSTKIAGIADISTPIERRELLGTKHYTAPEYLLGKPGTPKSDQFSLGCIVYQMLTGKLPYGEKLASVRDQRGISRLRYRPISETVTDLPHWVDKAIRKAVQLTPESRYEAMSEFESDLIKPNPDYLREEQLPLLQRNPVGFWRSLSMLLLISNLVLIYLLTH